MRAKNRNRSSEVGHFAVYAGSAVGWCYGGWWALLGVVTFIGWLAYTWSEG